jgi:hypothetical protein
LSDVSIFASATLTSIDIRRYVCSLLQAYSNSTTREYRISEKNTEMVQFARKT